MVRLVHLKGHRLSRGGPADVNSSKSRVLFLTYSVLLLTLAADC